MWTRNNSSPWLANFDGRRLLLVDDGKHIIENPAAFGQHRTVGMIVVDSPRSYLFPILQLNSSTKHHLLHLSRYHCSPVLDHSKAIIVSKPSWQSNSHSTYFQYIFLVLWSSDLHLSFFSTISHWIVSQYACHFLFISGIFRTSLQRPLSSLTFLAREIFLRVQSICWPCRNRDVFWMGNKAAGPAETPYLVANAVGMNVKPSRIVELEVKVAGGTKALGTVLTEKARRNVPGEKGVAGVQTKAAKHNTTLSW